ncbi:hypothetical protein BKA63DRAFT_537994 [Paraphoma chrysanthemicola]|nr:hypothetical protein BKA63DRAFT_537994 [Paraphoma chrysanthemicola]
MAIPEKSQLNDPLPRPQRFVTSHNSLGKAIFSAHLPDTVDFWAVGPKHEPAGFGLAYATSTFPIPLCNDEDLQDMKTIYADRKNSGLVRRGGSVLRYVDYPPYASSPMHRTVSCDYGIVISGYMDCVLDSGESRSLKIGDVVVQRGTMHQWINRGETWARMLYVLLDATTMKFNGKELTEDLGGMENVAESS